MATGTESANDINVINGRSADDSLTGSVGDDLISGRGGGDAIYGRDGDDTLEGGRGADTLVGGTDHDRLSGSGGDDLLVGQKGSDTLDGGLGNDSLRAGAGADVLYGSEGFDTLKGGTGGDTFRLGANASKAFGEAGDDHFIVDLTELSGEAKRINGGTGHDTLNIKVDPALLATLLAEFDDFVANKPFYSETLDLTLRRIERVTFNGEERVLIDEQEPPAAAQPLNADPTRQGPVETVYYTDDHRMDDQPGITMPPSGVPYTLILDETFDYADTDAFVAALNDGTTGVWSTTLKHEERVLNGRHSFYSDPRLTQKDGTPLGLNPFEIDDGVLKISAGLVPDAKVDDIEAILAAAKSKQTLSKQLPYPHENDPDHKGGIDYYYTGALSTDQSWAETYGYYEMKVSLPEGKGFFPAFWLTTAMKGWPPEIDILENVGHNNKFHFNVLFDQYGAGDDVDNAVYEMDIINDRGLDFAHLNEGFSREAYENGEYLDPKSGATWNYNWRKDGHGQWVPRFGNYEVIAKTASHNEKANTFTSSIVLEEELYRLGLIDDVAAHEKMIYSDSFITAAEWTPNEIIFYAGLSSDNLFEVLRVETPEDHTTAQYLIASLQFGGAWAKYPLQSEYEETFQQSMDIDHIKMYALAPDDEVAVGRKQIYIYGCDAGHETVYENGASGAVAGNQGAFERTIWGNDVIVGNGRNNVITGGTGLDEFTGGNGADTFLVRGGEGNKIITDFDPSEGDVLRLEGFHADGARGAFEMMSQVGNDVWLVNGADPQQPQTIILRDITLYEFSPASLKVVGSEGKTPHSGDAVTNAVLGGTKVVGTDDHDRLRTTIKKGGETFRDLDLEGGKGDDLYLVYSLSSEIVENENEGVDTVQTGRAYVLPDNVEVLRGLSDGGQRLTGNDLSNRIEAGRGDDTLKGHGGDDLFLIAEGGADTLIYARGDGLDVIEGFGEDDLIKFVDYRFKGFTDLSYHLKARGRDVLLDLGGDDGILFRDASLEDFDPSSFTFEDGRLVFGETVPDEGAHMAFLANMVEGTAGEDLLSGYASRDVFVFGFEDSFDQASDRSETAITDAIINFDADDGDALDLSDVLRGARVEAGLKRLREEDWEAFVDIVVDGGDTRVMIDRDGAGAERSFDTVAFMRDVVLNEDVRTLVDEGSLILA